MTKPLIGPVLTSYGWDGHVTGYGAWRKTRCPFHDDRHASAAVNEEEQAFKCFACDISGDAYAIVMQHEGIGFEDAKRRVQGITGASSQQLSGRTPARLASSKLPAWTRNRPGGGRRLSSGRGRREHS